MKAIKEIYNEWDPGDWFIAIFVVSLFSLIVVIITNLIKSDDKVDFCYISFTNQSGVPNTDIYVVREHIPWGNDNVLGSAKTFEEANIIMKNNCPIK